MRRAVFIFGVLSLVACGINIIGEKRTSKSSSNPSGTPNTPNAVVPSSNPSAFFPPPPPGFDAAACVAIPVQSTTNGDRAVNAYRSQTAKVLANGATSFGSCPSFFMTLATAAKTKGTPEAQARVTVEWESTELWILAEVNDPTPHEGTNDGALYENDSFELYASGSPATTSDYRSSDLQLIVDHRSLAQDYSGGAAVGTNYPNATTLSTSNGYQYVIRVDAARLGLASFTAGTDIRLDALLNDGLGQANALTWAMQSFAGSCPCTPSSCACNGPSRDPRLFGVLHLLP